MNTKTSFSLLAIAVAVFLVSGICYADSYHYRNILIGERAAGLGGAYTAISDDPSGMYYNPAGIVYSYGSNVSAGANAYHNTQKTYKGVFGKQSWNREASSLLPNFFGVVQQMGEGRIGISYVVPDSVIEDQDQTFHNIPSNVDSDGNGSSNTIADYTVNFNNDDNTYNIGLSYAQEVTEGFAAGFTLYFHQRRIQQVLNQYIVFDSGHSLWENYYYESEETGLRPILGFMWSPADKVSVGLSISKIFITGSNTSSQSTTQDNYTPVSTITKAHSDEMREYPVEIKLGISHFPSDKFLYSGEVSFYTEEDDELDGNRAWVMNFALGMEYYLTSIHAVRAGVFSNMSSAPELKKGVSGDADEHVDMLGASLSLTRFGKGSSLTLGGVYSQGEGESQITGDPSDIQDMEIKSFTVFLSNSYGF